MNLQLPQLIRQVSNVSLICKRFYTITLRAEIAVLSTTSKTYKLISNYNKNIFINSTVSGTKQHFSMYISLNRTALPTPHWIAKMHNSPNDTGFITASKQ